MCASMSEDQSVPAGAMPSAESQDSADAVSLVSTLDILALAALGLAGLYFLILRHRKKRDELNSVQSYTITPSTMTTTETACFIDKMLTSGKNMLVVYGSQTGTAEEFATRIAKECRRYGMKGLVADPEECNMQDLPRLVEIKKHLVVFLMATYGEGDPTDNAQEFYEWIKEEEAADLTGINYTVFALGNKTYEHFNAAGKLVDRRMSELGATRIFELGLGDDDANIEEDFLSWKERMLPYAKEFLGFEDSGEEEKRQYELKVLEDVGEEDAVFTGELSRLRAFTRQRPPFDAKNPYLAPLRVNRRLHKSGDRELMHLELDISGSRIRYEAGDHVAVYPVNDATLVDKMGELLNTDLDTIISLTAIDPDTAKKHPFPCPTRYRTALSHYLDITAVPKHFLLRELLDFTTGDEDRANLTLMSSNTEEGRAAYHTWVVEACRNIVHLLEDLPSCRPPLDLLCELLPRLQPRYYSISSSSKVHPECVHITCVLVRYGTSTGRENRGVATWWLLNHAVSEQLQRSAPAGDDAQQLQLPIPRHLTVPCFVRKSQFRLPVKTTTPIILVGPGTGLAPMRGFIQERAYQRQQGKEVGDTWLFYGCRRKEEDYMYQEELEQFEKEGVIKLVLAFSRDQADKVYVTHRLREHAAALWQLIDAQRAHIYVCGDAKVMARDVNALLHDVCRQQGDMNEQDADQYVKKMRTQKRYSEDVWS